jgi:hypothetical protein
VKIYIAASFADKHYMRVVRNALMDQGHTVTSDWLDTEGDGMIPEDISGDTARAQNGALTDMRGIRTAEWVAVFTDTPSTTGGLHVELGIGIGLKKKVVVVGPLLNVFCALPIIEHFDNVGDFLDRTEKIQERRIRTDAATSS